MRGALKALGITVIAGLAVATLALFPPLRRQLRAAFDRLAFLQHDQAFGMRGAFNELALRLAPGAAERAIVAVAVAGCASDGIHASGSRDDGRMPAWRRVAPDLLQPPPRYPAPGAPVTISGTSLAFMLHSRSGASRTGSRR